MKVKTFKREEYRKCPVYYRNLKDHFEYLTVIKGQLYTAHITVKPYWITNLLSRLDLASGFDKVPYSQEQLKHILGTLRKMAETTIDFVLDKRRK